METKYEIWIDFNNNKPRLQLPVNPPKISISTKEENKKSNDDNKDNKKQAFDIKEIEFSSIFPAKYGPYCDSIKYDNPWNIVELIEKHKNKSPVRLTITNTPINFLVDIESFKYSEEGGDVGTIHYDIKFKEHREVTPSEININNGNSGKIQGEISREKSTRPNNRQRNIK